MLNRVTGLEVVAHQAGIAHRHRVPRGKSGQAIVDAREFHCAVIELTFGNGAGLEVDRPAVQHRPVGEAAVVAPQLGVADHLQHNGLAIVIGIGNMEHIAGIDIKPPDRPERVVAA